MMRGMFGPSEERPSFQSAVRKTLAAGKAAVLEESAMTFHKLMDQVGVTAEEHALISVKMQGNSYAIVPSCAVRACPASKTD